ASHSLILHFFIFNHPASIYFFTLSLHDALPISTFLEFNNSISVMAKKGRMVALNASPINTSNTGSSRNKNNMDGNVNQSKYARRSEERRVGKERRERRAPED